MSKWSYMVDAVAVILVSILLFTLVYIDNLFGFTVNKKEEV